MYLGDRRLPVVVPAKAPDRVQIRYGLQGPTLVTLMRIPELDLQIDDLPSMSRKRVCELLALPRGSACTSLPAPSGPRPCSVTAEHCR